MKRAENAITEIRELATRGLDAEWKAIDKGIRQVLRTSNGRAGSGNAPRAEFSKAVELVGRAVDRRLVTLLEVCRSRSVRPDLVLRPAVAAIEEFFVDRVRAYGHKRANGQGRCRQSPEVIQRECAWAMSEIRRAVKDAQALALEGHAGGRLVFSRADWPKPPWKRVLGSAWTFVPTGIRALFPRRWRRRVRESIG